MKFSLVIAVSLLLSSWANAASPQPNVAIESKQLWFTILALTPLLSLLRFEAGVTRAIAGVVVAPSGSPLSNASVEAVSLASNDSNAGQLRWIQADHDGRFRITLSAGRYEIRAKDEIDGYPDPNFLLSSDSQASFPTITVDGGDITGVKVKVAGKGGILEGEILDKATRSPLAKGKVTIADAHKPEVFVEIFADKEGHFSFVVPSKAILISGSAPGYGVARFEGTSGVTLSAGEHRRIILELSPP